MSIKLTCQCGKRLKVPDTMAGKQGKCPDCGVVISVPGAKSTPASAEASRKCGGCGAPMNDAAVICVSCGYHRSWGSYIQTNTNHEDAEPQRKTLLRLMGFDITLTRLAIVGIPLLLLTAWSIAGPIMGIHIFSGGKLAAPPTTSVGTNPATAAGQKSSSVISPNSPLAYFKVLAQARDKAKGIVSASAMHQIGIGLRLYLDQNQGRWPQRLEDLRPFLGNMNELLKNPRTGANPGFLYQPPPPGADPVTTPVLFEILNGNKDPDGAVLYADGHIEQ